MKKNPRTYLFATLGMAATALSGCGSDSTGKTFDFAAVAPVVASATPDGLKTAATASYFRKTSIFAKISEFFIPQSFASISYSSTAKDSISAMFNGTFGKISGGNGIGYVNSNLEDLDSRMDEVELRFAADNLPACMSGTVADHVVDFSAHADANITLKAQCRDVFAQTAGEQSKPGSGLVFGKSVASGTTPSTASLMLMLKHATSSTYGGTDSYDAGFGYAANLVGAGTADEAVTLLFGQFNTEGSTATQDQPLMAKVYSKTSTEVFELVMAGSSLGSGGPISGGSMTAGCGFKLKSNGTLIYAKGSTVASGTCTTGTHVNFEVCLNATDLSDAYATSASACDTYAAEAFVLDGSNGTSIDTWTYSLVTSSNAATASASIFEALRPSSDAVAASTSALSKSR